MSCNCQNHMLMDGRWLIINLIVNSSSKSRERWEKILCNELYMTKCSARWVPRFCYLITGKSDSVWCKSTWFPRWVSGAKLWARYKDKTRAVEISLLDSSIEDQGRFICRVGHLASVILYATGIVFIDYLQNGLTINGNYYTNVLRHLQKSTKLPRNQTKGVLIIRTILQHTSRWFKCLRGCLFELVDYSLYPSDLAWS